MFLGLTALIIWTDWEERGGCLLWLSFGHFVFKEKWRNTHPPPPPDCYVCPEVSRFSSSESHAGTAHFHPRNPIRGCKEARDLWRKKSYCLWLCDLLWETCIPHLLLSYQFCRDVKIASAPKPVCRSPFASSTSTPPNCWDDNNLLSQCLVLSDDWLSLQHHEQSEQKLSC